MTVQKRENQHAVIYFEPKASPAMKELGNKIRSEGGRTTLVWSSRWRGPESILTEVKAVVVQDGCAKADEIVEAYRKFSHDVEIHYVDQDGAFVSPEGEEDDAPSECEEVREADTTVPEAEDSDGDLRDTAAEADTAADPDGGAEDDTFGEDGDEEDADSGGSEKS